jgi:hypothetical protein
MVKAEDDADAFDNCVPVLGHGGGELLLQGASSIAALLHHNA